MWIIFFSLKFTVPLALSCTAPGRYRAEWERQTDRQNDSRTFPNKTSPAIKYMFVALRETDRRDKDRDVFL